MNSTPALSRARRTARSLATVIDVSSSAPSARRIVASPRAASRARSSALQRNKPRAALICGLVKGFNLDVDFIRILRYVSDHMILSWNRSKIANVISGQRGSHELKCVDKNDEGSPQFHRWLGRPDHLGRRRGRPSPLMARETRRG